MFPEYGFEVQFIRYIEVGRYRFRVAVDHDGFVTHFLEGQQAVDAAVVEFYPLANPVGTGA